MTLDEAKDLIEYSRNKGLRSVAFGNFAIEFFETKPELMNLDPVSLAKTFADSMPPDSAMMFASTEDPEPETQNPIQKQLETNEMA